MSGTTNERDLLMRARDYLAALSRGEHPLTGQPLDADAAWNEQRLRRCFAFVAAYLQRELSRSPITETEVFLPTPAQAEHICAPEALSLSDFLRRLDEAAAASGKQSIPSREIGRWLMQLGAVDGRVESVFVDKRILRANDCSEQFGIFETLRMNPKSGALTPILMLSPEAQRWLLQRLPELVTPPKEEV